MLYSILLLDMLHCSPPFEYINPLVKNASADSLKSASFKRKKS